VASVGITLALAALRWTRNVLLSILEHRLARFASILFWCILGTVALGIVAAVLDAANPPVRLRGRILLVSLTPAAIAVVVAGLPLFHRLAGAVRQARRQARKLPGTTITRARE
jgi:hypothetical protein